MLQLGELSCYVPLQYYTTKESCVIAYAKARNVTCFNSKVDLEDYCDTYILVLLNYYMLNIITTKYACLIIVDYKVHASYEYSYMDLGDWSLASEGIIELIVVDWVHKLGLNTSQNSLNSKCLMKFFNELRDDNFAPTSHHTSLHWNWGNFDMDITWGTQGPPFFAT